MASLTIVVDGVEQKVPLESASVTLGRGLESDVRLKDIKASRRHCQVVKTSKGYECVDLSSGNGTYINGVQIKSQALAAGDKITIGSTTVLFEDTPRPVASTKAPTAKIPVAAAPAPPKPPASKIATAKVHVVPTKRTTERVEAPRSGPQAAVKAAGQSVSKSGSRVGRPSGRLPAVRPSRPAPEAPKGKGPGLLIAAGAAVLLLGVGAYALFGSRDNGGQIKDQIEQLKKKGDLARDQEHFDAALQEYRAAQALCQGERYKIQASELSERIAQVERRKGAGAAPKTEPKDAPDKDGEFLAKKTEIGEKHKLGEAAADWGGALKDWADFASRKSPGDAARAQGEIRSLQTKAQEEATRLKAKAELLVKENKMAEAVDLLKHQSGRFEGTDAKVELDAAIKDLEK